MSRPLYTTDIKGIVDLDEVLTLEDSYYLLITNPSGEYFKIGGDKIGAGDLESLSGSSLARIINLETVFATASSAFAQTDQILTAQVNDNLAQIQNTQTVFASTSSAFAQSITTLEATVDLLSGGDVSEITSSITNIETVFASASATFANQFVVLESTIELLSGGNIAANITDFKVTFAATSGAFTSRFASAESSINGNTASISNVESTFASASGVFSENISTVKATADGAASSVSTNSSAIATLNGYANASYAVTLNVNGQATGFTLVDGSDSESTFSILADNFIVTDGSTNQLYYDAGNNRLVLEDGRFEGGSINIGTAGSFSDFYSDENYTSVGGTANGVVFQPLTDLGATTTAIGLNMAFGYTNEGTYIASWETASGPYNRIQMGGSNTSLNVDCDNRSGSDASFIELKARNGIIGSQNTVTIEAKDDGNNKSQILLTNKGGTQIQIEASGSDTYIDINDPSGKLYINSVQVVGARDTSWNTTNMLDEVNKTANLDTIANTGGANEKILAQVLEGVISTLKDHGLLG